MPHLHLVPVPFCLNSSELWAGLCDGNIYLVKSRKPIDLVHTCEMLITKASAKPRDDRDLAGHLVQTSSRPTPQHMDLALGKACSSGAQPCPSMEQLDPKPKICAHPAVPKTSMSQTGPSVRAEERRSRKTECPRELGDGDRYWPKPSYVLDGGDKSPGTREGGTLRYEKSSCHQDLEAASPSTECHQVTGSSLLCVLASNAHRVWRTRHPAREKRGDPGLPGSSEPSGQ